MKTEYTPKWTKPSLGELAAQWRTEQGDHEECPVCHSQCRDAFLGNDLTPAQRQAPALYEALRGLLAYIRELEPDEPLFSSDPHQQAEDVAAAERVLREVEGQ